VGAVIGSAVNFTANTWTSVDVTSLVKTAGVYSFEINATSANLKKYASRETGANAPQLVLETSAPASQPAAVSAVTGEHASERDCQHGLWHEPRGQGGRRLLAAGRRRNRHLHGSGERGERQLCILGCLATAVSGADGVATAPQLTANATAGSFTATASVAGVSAPANFSLTNQAATGATTATITASADGYVQSDLPSTNFGSAAVLKNNTSPDTRAYLKFNLTGISGTVTKATFRVYTQTSSGSGYELHGVADNSWVEPGSPTATDRR